MATDSGRNHIESWPDIGANMSTRLGVVAGLCLSILFFSGCIVDRAGADLDPDQCDPMSEDCVRELGPDVESRGVIADAAAMQHPGGDAGARSDGALSLSPACIRVSSRSIEYSASPVDQLATKSIRIESCGGQPVTITQLRISDDPDGAFQIIEENLGEPIELAAYSSEDQSAGRPAPSIEVTVGFQPDQVGVFNGRLLISSDARETPEISVQLVGGGARNVCPSAAVREAQFAVGQGDQIILDGSPSVDVDGSDGLPVRYEWTVIDRPLGSRAQPTERPSDPWNRGPTPEEDDQATAIASFTPDAVGQYTLELNVVDEQGMSARDCDQMARVMVELEAPEGLHIQLTWRTPGDDDPDDADGADLDLHFAHPNALEWGGQPLDRHWTCFSLNPTPDWGDLSNRYDNPVLNDDVSDGRAPETISLSRLENTGALGAPYLVGVNYYRDRGRGLRPLGPSYARLRIYYDNVLVWTFDGSDGEEHDGERELDSSDLFWSAVQIEAPELRFTVRDRIFQTRP